MNTGKHIFRVAGQVAVLLLLLLSILLPAGAAQAAAPDLLPPCGQPPAAGNWTINASCDLKSPVIAPQNVTITNNATVTVPGGRWLNVDFTNSYLRIMPGSALLIQPGGRAYSFLLGHTFLNNTDGTFGYYLKRVGGGVMESYRDETVRSDIIRARMDTQEKIIYTPALQLLDNITT